MATITNPIIQKIIYHLLKGEDYRIEVVTLINAEFLQYAIDFFKKVVDAKFRNSSLTVDWYKKEFLNDNLPSDELIINSGLNKKTISNMYNSARREIVLDATKEHYENLYIAINNLVEQGNEIDLTLTIKFQGVSVDLNMNESLIVINALAVKRAELRGGAWSSSGKQVEKSLMLTLCNLYSVPENNYKMTGLTGEEREVDFFLIDVQDTKYQCEVKLMGKGNPESADAVIARDSQVFVADKLSDLNKRQLDNLGIKWVELRNEIGFRKFKSILEELRIPHDGLATDWEEKLKNFSL